MTSELIERMTLAEKVGQLNMPLVFGEPMVGGGFQFAPATLEAFERFAEGAHDEDIGPGGGFFGLSGFFLLGGPREQAVFYNRLQEIATKSRLGVPMLQIAEGTHGLLAAGATVFPEGPALGSTWDPDLLKRVYAAVAREARAVGIHAICTLVVEPIRDPRLGRNCEAYTEDPYLLTHYTRAIVHGAQGEEIGAADKAVAVLCHYPIQSEPVSGLERGAMDISERQLRDTFLPSWIAGITDAGALGVMATYAAIDGVPAHGSRRLLTELLRDELGFDGVVLSEGIGFDTLIYEGIVETQGEAGAICLEAGVDVNITYEDAYLRPLIDNVERGVVTDEVVDRAVSRVIELKERLGLFTDPFVDPDRAAEIVHCTEHVDLALEAALQGIVLLKNNDSLLPLSSTSGRIAVIGPNADAPVNQLGDYTIAMFKPHTATDLLPPIKTVLHGIRERAQGDVVYAMGCRVLGDDTSGFSEAVDAARSADVAIVVVGEQQQSIEGGRQTVGERSDVASLDLTGVQEELIKAVVESGTPTVVVLVNGRPLSVRWTAENAQAIVEAWLPGERGGEALAKILFGDVAPSGRLPVTIPRHVGQLPVYYNHLVSKAHWADRGYSYVDLPATPLWEFGFGLSYTTFDYADLRIDPSRATPDETVRVSVDVTNVGERAGVETVQLYLRDVLASVAPRAKQLRGFARAELEPGKTKTIEFSITERDLHMLDRDLRWVVEPGDFEVQVGASSQDIRVRGTFAVLPY